jgi:hypothetical protein
MASSEKREREILEGRLWEKIHYRPGDRVVAHHHSGNEVIGTVSAVRRNKYGRFCYVVELDTPIVYSTTSGGTRGREIKGNYIHYYPKNPLLTLA